jgi:P4 family phage/plasmid primase-like protien
MSEDHKDLNGVTQDIYHENTKVRFTHFENIDSNLSKRYDVINGSIVKTPAAALTKGIASSMTCSFPEFFEMLSEAESTVAFGYGVHSSVYNDRVAITVSGKEDPANNVLARTKSFYDYSEGAGILMLDYDPSEYGQDMTPDKLLEALVTIDNKVSGAAKIVRPSLSSGIGMIGYEGTVNRGFHIYIPVANAEDIPRYGKLLFDRLWLADLGYIALSKNGAMLIRTVIDGVVFAPERLDFVGKPIIDSPNLEYKPIEPQYHAGNILDTSTLPNLSVAESTLLENKIANSKSAIQVKSMAIQTEWADQRVKDLESKGIVNAKAREWVSDLIKGGSKHLYPNFMLEFTDSRLGLVTVGDILVNPDLFSGKSLADPIEGSSYGKSTAKFYWNDGKPVINSLAHGQNTQYYLKLEVEYVQSDFNDLVVQSKIHVEHTPIFNTPNLLGVDVRDGTSNSRPLSEMGNAQRLVDNHINDLFYIKSNKSWLAWNDGSWHWDSYNEYINKYANKLPAQIYQEGNLHLTDASLFLKWSRASQRNATITATISMLKNMEGMRLDLSLIDSNIFQIGLDNARQVIDLKTGKVRCALRSDYITKSLNVNYLGDTSQATRWLEFLNQIFDGDEEMIIWMKRWCGYLLTGSTAEHIFLFCYGIGSNGKSVFAEVLRYILQDYSRAIAVETVSESKRQAGSATPDLVDLIGARMVISSETEDNVALSESLVKSLVSGDAMSVRGLYSAPIQFIPQFKLMMLGNHKPIIRGADDGIWRMIRLIPFNRTFSASERDPYLADKLKNEAPHILAWMVQGCLEWQEHGLSELPRLILNSTKDYREEQDLIGGWIAECCEEISGKESTSSELYKSYQAWCIESGLRVASKIAFSRRLADRGFASRKSNGNTWVSGLCIQYVYTGYTASANTSSSFSGFVY